MFPIACYQATGQHYAHSALNDRFPAILNAQNPAIPSAHPHSSNEFKYFPDNAIFLTGEICTF